MESGDSELLSHRFRYKDYENVMDQLLELAVLLAYDFDFYFRYAVQKGTAKLLQDKMPLDYRLK